MMVVKFLHSLFFFLFAIKTDPIMKERVAKTVSSNGRVRGNTQRRGFESHTILFILFFAK